MEMFLELSSFLIFLEFLNSNYLQWIVRPELEHYRPMVWTMLLPALHIHLSIFVASFEENKVAFYRPLNEQGMLPWCNYSFYMRIPLGAPVVQTSLHSRL